MIEKEEYRYVQELRKGSERAFTVLYDHYYSILFAFCLQWTKSSEQSREIVQETFTALWQSKEVIIEDRTIKFFLFRVAKNRLINSYRKTVNSKIFEEYTVYCNENRLYTPDAASDIEYDDFRNRVYSLSALLPKSQRIIFQMIVLHQKSNQETAVILDLSEQTIRNQLSTALKKMRLYLKCYR